MAGSSQDFIFKVVEPINASSSALSISLQYDHLVPFSTQGSVSLGFSTRSVTDVTEVLLSSRAEEPLHSLNFELHRARLTVVDLLRSILKQGVGSDIDLFPNPAYSQEIAECVRHCNSILESIRAYGADLVRSHPAEVKEITARVSGLKEDLTGQITEVCIYAS